MKSRVILTTLALSMGGFFFPQTSVSAETIIKFSHNMPPKKTATYHRYFLKFQELANKYTNNAVTLREFPAAQMGSDQKAAKKLQLGTIEMMAVASNNLAQLYGGFDLFTLPFIFKNLACATDHVLTDKGLLNDISSGAQKKANIRVLAFGVGGMRNMMNSKKPILTPADLKGVRMRVAKNPIQLDTYKALGADAIGIAAKETYSALQTRVVDGHDGGSSWAYSHKLHEVQKYISITGHQVVVVSVIMNNKAFNKLSKKVQVGLTRAAQEAATDNMNYMKNNESTIMGHFRKAGLKFSEPDLAPFRSAVKDVWGKYADRVGGWDRINRVQELQKQCK
ncbi:MAG: TRAP transporter substrate-binding protein [Rhodospirillales bacterium]|jgi:tripartite ATP-independent transporter DctP family solute receptor